MALSYANDFCWYDLHTADKAGSTAFYEALFGWKIETQQGHTGFMNGEQGFGGLEALEAGQPAFWLGYLGVDDCAARVQKLVGLGGTAVMDGLEIPDVGTIGVLADPSGAAFALYQPAGGQSEVDWQPSTSQPGDFCWAELSTNDLDEARDFYAAGFGWGTGKVMDSAPDGYHLMTYGGEPKFGIYERPPEMPACSWTHCIFVEDVGATAAKAVELGATLVAEVQVPAPWFGFASKSGQASLALVTDPQGATFGLLGRGAE